MTHSQSPSRSRAGLAWTAGGQERAILRQTPTEGAIGLSYNGRPHTVLMATPQDVEDLAVGFTLTEGIALPGEIMSIDIEAKPEGLLVDLKLSPAARAHKARPRGLEGRSSCGLCGVQRLADAVRALPMIDSALRLEPEAIQLALAALETRQPLGQLTRATHAAGFASQDGTLGLVREDVGRHNALDKLAGAMAREGVDAARGFVLVTSRCSFEMVEKTARMGCPVIVAISAPTDLAIAKAEEAGITLVGLARTDGHTVFTRPDRLGLALAAA